MEAIHIQTDSKQYDVFLGEDVLKQIPSFLESRFQDLTRIMIITDETVGRLHLDKLETALTGWKPVVYTAPGGEKAKTFEVYFAALSTALENRLDRKSVILSFGGGAVGDLSGFVAATFMRGIPFVQIPTTILSHDSAVGGKVAINHPLGKNMVGAFHQPEAVFFDISLLNTLPLHEVRSGFAEVIKHGLIADPVFFEWLQENIKDLTSLTSEQLFYFLTKGIEIKNQFVSIDEKEQGIRAFLNFGHTLGHAIEAEMGYGNFTHGEAVLIGMIFALHLSRELSGLAFDIDNFSKWAGMLGYTTDIPVNLKNEALLNKMKQDKKSVGENVRFVLLEEVGKPVLKGISDDVILSQLDKFRKGGIS